MVVLTLVRFFAKETPWKRYTQCIRAVENLLKPCTLHDRPEFFRHSPNRLPASTAELLQAIGEDRIDIALCAGEPFGANIVTRLPMKWFGYPDLLLDDVVPPVSSGRAASAGRRRTPMAHGAHHPEP